MESKNQPEVLTDAADAKKEIVTAIQAIDTASDGLNLYSNVLDQLIPWKKFKEELPTSNVGYSHESAELVGNIKTQLMNVTDAYFATTQSIWEWCNQCESLLKLYIRLFNEENASNQMIQKNHMIHVLEAQNEAINNSQVHLDNCTENLDTASKHLTSLKFHLNKDLDENGEYFQRKIRQILRESHDPAATSCKWPFCCGKKSTNIDSMEEKVIHELKEKLRIVREFYENLKVQIVQASIDVKQTQEKLTDQMKANDELIARVGESKTYAVDGDISELQNSAIELANNLIRHCDEYRSSHAN